MQGKPTNDFVNIEMVEPIRMTAKAQCEKRLAATGYDVFAIGAEAVLSDLLIDSGTAAMSAEQWAAGEAT